MCFVGGCFCSAKPLAALERLSSQSASCTSHRGGPPLLSGLADERDERREGAMEKPDGEGFRIDRCRDVAHFSGP